MNNFVEYFYGINVDSIAYIGDCYSFKHNGYLYKIYSVNVNFEQIKFVFKLNQILIKNTLMSEIVINNYNDVISHYNNNDYILIKLFANTNKKISLEEINNLSNSFYSKNISSNWGKLWSNKIDYLENLINENGKKYPILVNSFNYFVGMCENAISYFYSIDIDANCKYFVCHKKIGIEDTVESLYNPLNIILDFRVRDVAEYLKNSFWNNNNSSLDELLNYLNYCFLPLTEVKLLISRLLYPSFYFELFEDILLNNKDEKILINVISRTNEYEKYLQNLIFLLKKYYIVEEINWLKKK